MELKVLRAPRKLATDPNRARGNSRRSAKFPLIALHSHTSGETVIEVKINSEGTVTSAEAVSGNHMVGSSRQIARVGSSPPTKDKSVRTARLTFVYRLVLRDTPVDSFCQSSSRLIEWR